MRESSFLALPPILGLAIHLALCKRIAERTFSCMFDVKSILTRLIRRHSRHAHAFAALVVLTSVSGALEPNTQFVAVGENGRRIFSKDGMLWEDDQRSSEAAEGAEDPLLDIAFGHGQFVAVGGRRGAGHTLSSRNGTRWTEWPKGPEPIGALVFGHGIFVAARGGELLHSLQGEEFQAGARLPIQGEVRALRSAFGDTEAGQAFVFIGHAELNSEGRRVHWRALTFDGASWAATLADTSPVRDIAYGAGHFVVAGSDGLIETSHDGQTWKKQMAAAEDFSRIVWTGKQFIVSGGVRGWTSRDGLTWTPELEGLPGDIVWSREGSLHLAFSRDGRIHVSKDLVRWERASAAPGPRLHAIAVGQLPVPR